MKIFYIARSICFLLFSTIHFVAYTQTKKLRFDHPALEKGIRNIPVNCMLQDSKGYLWVGTSDGLVKYDGYNFIYYKHIAYDTTSLIDNWVISLWEDKDGTIWIGTAEAGLSKFDRRTGKFTQYRPEPDSASFVPPFRAVSAINEGGDGSLWAGNWLGEIRRFNKRTATYFPEKYDLGYRRNLDTLRANNTIFVIFKDRSGIIWIGDQTGLHKINSIPGKRNESPKISFTHYRHDPGNPSSLSSNMVTSIFEDHTGMLWIGTGGWGWEGGGLNRLDPKTGIFTRFQHDAKDPHSISSNAIFINNIAEDTAGNLWIGTENGLNKLNKDRTQFTSYFHDPNDPQSIGGNGISSLLIDRSHIIWVAVSGGIDKIDPNQKPFVLYRHNPSDDHSLSNDNVTGIYGDKKGITWISTFGGMDAFDKNTGTFTHYRHNPDDPSTLGHDNIYALSEDKDQDGNMWVYSGNSPFVGLWSLFNSNTGKFKPYSRDSTRFREIYKDAFSIGYEDSHGLLWLGTINGLKRFDRKTGETIHYRHDPYNSQGPADNNIWNLMEDNKGYLWIGHPSVGITRLDIRTGIFTHYLPDVRDSTTLSSPVVYSIYQDSKENLWFGTKGGGLCRFNYEKETFTTYSEKQGLADNNIFSIKEDIEGNLWLGTVKGISRFSPAMHTFMNYDSADGLPGTIDQDVCFSDRDGILYYGGSKGLTVFDPRQLKPNPYTPPVVITQFTLFDKPVLGKNEAEEILLNHDENFFSFEFSALNYTNSSKNQYAYQLVGVDKDWVYSGTRRVASYTNIGPGEYTFRVKASNNDGIWNEKGTSVRIIIHPPWWRTNWAYAFYGLCFLAGMFAIDRYQRRRLIQRERERAREKELLQARQIEKAYTELKATQAQLIQSEKMASLGELTAGIAHEIQNPLNFVNNFSEVNKELIEELKGERDKVEAERNTAIEDEILNDIDQNLEKISFHGKRADAIVKGMLQHSKQTSGIKEPTDINALCDEYLRLSYHGMRAKDKSFNADYKTDFDDSIGKVNIVPQDIGRVLLNLFNNAFYAVKPPNPLKGENYKPLVTVSTKKIPPLQGMESKIEIIVKDNGNGIPQNIIDKIFQPFFTTKPTGQGTGLGLSLAYDIIKAHDGEIKVESKEGHGTDFIIQLPA